MPIAREKYNGESGTLSPTQNNHELPYIVFPDTGESPPTLSAAINAVLAVAPSNISSPDGKNLVQSGFRYESLHDDGIGDEAIWEIAVQYGNQEFSAQEEGSTRIRFDMTGGTQKITQSIATLQVKKAGGTESSDFFKGTIGNTGEEVEGVEIGLRVFKFTVTKVFELLDMPSLTDLYYMDHTVNDSTFTVIDSVTGLTLTFLAGECKFLGATGGESRADGMIEIVFNFEASPNATGLVAGDITGINKGGWDYLWIRYNKDVVGTGASKILINKPVFAVVEQVFYDSDFDLLGL